MTPALVGLLAVASLAGAPPIWLLHVGLKEEGRIRLYDEDGRLRVESRRDLERLMRCHHSGERRRIHPRLIELIARVSEHFAGRRIEIVSGYRAPKYSKTRRSAHVQGRAVDFRVEGVANDSLRDYVRSFTEVGVGYYPRSSFVHLDVRKVSAFWVDYSGPGQRARYSEDPERDVAIERLIRGQDSPTGR